MRIWDVQGLYCDTRARRGRHCTSSTGSSLAQMRNNRVGCAQSPHEPTRGLSSLETCESKEREVLELNWFSSLLPPLWKMATKPCFYSRRPPCLLPLWVIVGRFHLGFAFMSEWRYRNITFCFFRLGRLCSKELYLNRRNQNGVRCSWMEQFLMASIGLFLYAVSCPLFDGVMSGHAWSNTLKGGQTLCFGRYCMLLCALPNKHLSHKTGQRSHLVVEAQSRGKKNEPKRFL